MIDGISLELALECLAEEAAEVQQVKSKIIRFGLHDNYKEIEKGTNKERLEVEIGHFMAMASRLVILGFLDKKKIEDSQDDKTKTCLYCGGRLTSSHEKTKNGIKSTQTCSFCNKEILAQVKNVDKR